MCVCVWVFYSDAVKLRNKNTSFKSAKPHVGWMEGRKNNVNTCTWMYFYDCLCEYNYVCCIGCLRGIKSHGAQTWCPGPCLNVAALIRCDWVQSTVKLLMSHYRLFSSALMGCCTGECYIYISQCIPQRGHDILKHYYFSLYIYVMLYDVITFCNAIRYLIL